MATLVLSTPVAAAGAPGRDCPPGMVYSGTKCEYQDLCNGKPFQVGQTCVQEKPAPPAPPAAPAPPPPPAPAPAKPPVVSPPVRHLPHLECQGLIVAAVGSSPAGRDGASSTAAEGVHRLLLSGGD